MTPQRKDAQLKIRLPRELLDAAKAKADSEDVPLSQVIRQLLREWVKSPKGRNKVR